MPKTEPKNAVETLEGKTVLVTGGTTGIGRAIAIALAAEGATIFTFGRHAKELKEGLSAIQKAGDADGMVADAAKREDIEAVFERIDEDWDSLDVLVANAGIAGDGLADVPEDEWRYVLETNVAGYMACAKEAAARMKKRKRGDIILIGSISANSRGKDSSVYVATKGAVQAFAESFSKEMAEYNVRVSLIEPGTIGTDMQGKPAPQRAKIAKHEMLYAEDIADVVRFVLTRPLRTNVVKTTVVPRMQEYG